MELTTGIKLIKNLEVTCLNDEKAMVDFETGKYFLLREAQLTISGITYRKKLQWKKL